MNTNNTATTISLVRAISTVMVLLFSTLVTASVNTPYQAAVGNVLGRGTVPLDPATGQGFYLVKYDTDGKEAEGFVVSLPEGLGDKRIVAVSDYNQEVAKLNTFKAQHLTGIARGAQVISAEQFARGAYRDGAVNAAGQAITPQALKNCVPNAAEARSILIKDKTLRYSIDACDVVLQTFTFDLSGSPSALAASLKSMIVDKDGRIDTQWSAPTEHRLGFRQGFYGTDEKPDDLQHRGYFSMNRRTDADIAMYLPLAGVPIKSSSKFDKVVAVTGATGSYSATYTTTPCPGFSYNHMSWLTAEVSYQNVLPTGAPVWRLMMTHPVAESCAYYSATLCGIPSAAAASACSAVEAIEASQSVPVNDVSFFVDFLVLQGEAYLAGVDVGSETQWQEPAGEVVKYTQSLLDLDGDGEFDVSQPGVLVPLSEADPSGSHENPNELVFVPKMLEEADYQGIYLSSSDSEAGVSAPDLLKVIDHKNSAANTSIGLFTQVTEQDLGNTDLYIFRDSNGELLMERRGVQDDEYRINNENNNQTDVDKFVYQIKLRGNNDSVLAIGTGSRYDQQTAGAAEEFKLWADRSGLEPQFHQRQSDHIRPGEVLRIVAINRSTGYIGTARHRVDQSAGGIASSLSAPIAMRPPSLRIWAERKYTVAKGASAGDKREYLIGQEGAATQGDTTVVVYTQWLDHDGSPLPSGLGRNEGKDFGYTGRIAKVGNPGELTGANISGISEFGIKPGLHAEVIQLPKGGSISAGHFYIHTIGKAINQECKQENYITCPLYSSGGAYANTNTNPSYQGRPRYSVPFQVPVVSEESYLQDLKSYRDLKAELEGQENPATDPSTLIKPKGHYLWATRPEYQFSVVDLQVQAILRENHEADGDLIDSTNVIDQSLPVISATDQLEILYGLSLGNGGPRLDTFDSTVENSLIFSVAGSEVIATIGADQSVRFDDLSHLNHLSTIDLLVLRLISNNDPGNTLWEWVFTKNGIKVSYSIPGNPADQKTGRCTLLPEQPDGKDIPIEKVTTVLGTVERVRTLGGIRLKYEYELPCQVPKTDFVDIKWKFNHAGRICKEYGVNRAGRPATVSTLAVPACQALAANTEYGGNDSDDLAIYWEPTITNGETKWVDDLNVTGTVKIRYIKPYGSDLERKEFDFNVVTRELAPDTANPMQGKDVEMLESVLWQIGVSPQKGAPGSEGARIGSNRSGIGAINTNSCQGNLADDREIFYSGWNACANGQVSTESMVRRFQARNATSTAHRNLVSSTVLNNATGRVNSDTLNNLGRDWVLYMSAHAQYASSPIISSTNNAPLLDTWVVDAVNLWTNGNGTRVPANTYTAAVHNNIVTLAGLTPAAANNRESFLKHWIGHESDYHWGSNAKGYQATAYRVNEGGADEHGSLSFSQLLYGHRFGQTPCAVHDEAGLNIYEPSDNVKTFVLHTASDNTAGGVQARCKGLMYRGFHANDQTLDRTFSTDTGRINGRRGNVDDLRGYKHNNGNVVVMAASEDNYDVLAKAVVGYNGGEGYADDYSWAKFLKYKQYNSNISRNTGTTCHSCRYSIEVRREIFGNHLRTFIWRGGIYPIGHPNAGQDWCFEFGENEWINPFNVRLPNGTISQAKFSDYQSRASQNNTYKVMCP